MATPLQIDIALFYWSHSAGDYGLDRDDFNFNAPAVREIFKDFVERGLLFRTTNGDRNYEPNQAALEPYVSALCETPFPVRRWVVERAA